MSASARGSMWLLASAACAILVAACDLQHKEERAYCEAADGDYDKCLAHADWCDVTGGPVCVRDPMTTGSCTVCAVDATRTYCVPMEFPSGKMAHEIDCHGCKLEMREAHCTPKNLCTTVVCL